MNPAQRFQNLQAAYLSGELSDTEAAEFTTLLEEYPAIRRAMLDDLEVEGMLSQLNAAQEAESFRRSLMERLDAQSHASGFTRGVSAKTSPTGRRSASLRVRHRGDPNSKSIWLAVSFIAGLAAVLMLMVSTAGNRRRNDISIKKPEQNSQRPSTTDSPEVTLARERQAQIEVMKVAAEERLKRLEAERKRLAETPGVPDSNREQALQELETRRIAAEKELAEWAAKRGKTPPAGNTDVKAPEPAANLEVADLLFVSGVNAGTLIQRNGDRVALKNGLKVHAGDRIEITGADTSAPAAVRATSAAVSMRSGATVDLAGNTVLDFTGPRALTLSSGMLYADVAKDYDITPAPADKYKLVITTPAASLGITGTRFELSTSASGATLRMEEGRLELFNEKGRQAVAALQECKAISGSAPSAPVALTGTIWRGRSGEFRVAVMEFQDGVSPTTQYAGTEDTTIDEKNPAVNNGKLDVLEVDDGDELNPPYTYITGLLRWKLQGVTKGSRVAAASVTLNLTDTAMARPFSLFELLQPFSEQNATWQRADAGKPWGSPGASGARDRGSRAIGKLDARELGPRTITIEDGGLPVIQRWVDSPEKNFGLLLTNSPNSGDGVKFNTHEAADPNVRPKLSLILLVPTGR